MSIEVLLNGNTDISDFVKSVDYSGDASKFNRQLSVSLLATNDGRKQAYKLEEGDTITFKYEGKIRFVGVVFSIDISSNGDMSITAYDSNVYLAKSNDNRIFTKKKASDIIKMLAQDFGIPIGNVEDTGFVIPYLKFQNTSLFDMIVTALTITQEQMGKRYFIGNDNGKLTLKEGATATTKYVFKDGENLISASYSRSIEDTKTQVKVIGGPKGKETVVVAKDDAKRSKYGVLQAVEVLDEKATESQIKQRASALLKEQSQVSEQLSVDVLGVAAVDVGSAVYIQNEMTKTGGAYYVTNITQSYSSDVFTMSLELSRTYELPEIQINDDVTTQEK